jgi:hypothetical protein
MKAIEKLLQKAEGTGRYCRGQVVLSILDAMQFFPELAPFAELYRDEIEFYRRGTFPTTPQKPAAIYDIDRVKPGEFVRLPKQYRRFFARAENGTGWRSFKGFDPQLGYKIAHGEIDIRRGADSPWGMKWLSGQIYTSILAWAIHAQHICQFGKLAPLPLPVIVTDIKEVYWDERMTLVEKLDLGGNRNYPWTPGHTEYCRLARHDMISGWIDALPDTMLARAIRETMHADAEGLGGVVYDMYPSLRLEMPTFFTNENIFQQNNYALALEQPLSEANALAAKVISFIEQKLRVDSDEWSQVRAKNLGVLIGLCRVLKINMLSFGVEASNIAADGSLPDLDTIQYRRDSIEWMSGEPLPPSVDFRYTAVRSNLQKFEAVKASKDLPRLSDSTIEEYILNGLTDVTNSNRTIKLRTKKQKDPSAVMHLLDTKLTLDNTIRFPGLPRYSITQGMPWPEGFVFLRCIGTGDNPPEVWFSLAVVGEFAALEVHHRDRNGVYQRLPGDYFHLSLKRLPRDFMDYLEEYIRLFLREGISEIIIYPDHVTKLKMEEV